MSCENIPTLETVQDFNTNAKVLNEVVTSNADETIQEDSNGQVKKTLAWLFKQGGSGGNGITNILNHENDSTVLQINSHYLLDASTAPFTVVMPLNPAVWSSLNITAVLGAETSDDTQSVLSPTLDGNGKNIIETADLELGFSYHLCQVEFLFDGTQWIANKVSERITDLSSWRMLVGDWDSNAHATMTGAHVAKLSFDELQPIVVDGLEYAELQGDDYTVFINGNKSTNSLYRQELTIISDDEKDLRMHGQVLVRSGKDFSQAKKIGWKPLTELPTAKLLSVSITTDMDQTFYLNDTVTLIAEAKYGDGSTVTSLEQPEIFTWSCSENLSISDDVLTVNGTGDSFVSVFITDHSDMNDNAMFSVLQELCIKSTYLNRSSYMYYGASMGVVSGGFGEFIQDELIFNGQRARLSSFYGEKHGSMASAYGHDITIELDEESDLPEWVTFVLNDGEFTITKPRYGTETTGTVWRSYYYSGNNGKDNAMFSFLQSKVGQDVYIKVEI